MDFTSAGVKLKIERAREHLSVLNSEIAAYLTSSPNTLTMQFDPERSGYVVMAHFPEPFARFGLIAGDIIQNLRSALDHLAGQAVRANGKKPNRATNFPIYKQLPPKACGHGHAVTIAPGIAEDICSLLNSLQPLTRLDETAQECDPLWTIHELSNRDKHRELIAAQVFMEAPTVSIYVGEPERPDVLLQQTAIGRVFKEDALIAFFPFAAEQPGVRVHAHGSSFIALDEADLGGISGVPLGDALTRLIEYVLEEIVVPFERLLYRMPDWGR